MTFFSEFDLQHFLKVTWFSNEVKTVLQSYLILRWWRGLVSSDPNLLVIDLMEVEISLFHIFMLLSQNKVNSQPRSAFFKRFAKLETLNALIEISYKNVLTHFKVMFWIQWRLSTILKTSNKSVWSNVF